MRRAQWIQSLPAGAHSGPMLSSPAMIPVRQFMPAVLADVLRHAPLTPEKVAFAWRSAVGPSVAQATAVELREGVLRVEAKDATWQREIERSAAVIRARLDALLGRAVVRYIDVTARGAAAARSASSAAAAAPARGTVRSAGESDSERRRR